MMELMEVIMNFGILPGLFIGFVVYFFKHEKKRDEKRDEQIAAKNELFQNIVNRYFEEGTRREDIMRQEFERREGQIREDAKKREDMLMKTLDNFSTSNDKIAGSIDDMKKTLAGIDVRLHVIEGSKKVNSHG